MSRNERQKIITDQFRENFDKIFGHQELKIAPDIEIMQANVKRMVESAEADISKNNTKLDKP